jgi:hypothetical protein
VILIAAIITVIVSVIWHILLHRFWLAVARSAFTSVLLYWMVSMSHFGWLDQTFFENVAWSLLLSSVVSVAIGNLVRKLEKNRGAP